MTGSNYTREEEERLVHALRARGVPLCPRCGARLVHQSVTPTGGLPYVRNRLWLTCAGCGRSIVLDRRRIEGEP